MQVQAIINKAFRKLGVIGSGRDPRPQESDDALDSFKSLIRGWVTAGAFGRLRDVVPQTSPYIAGENERILRESEEVTAVTFPSSYDDGTGQERPPLDLSVVVIIDLFTNEAADWLYDGQVKKWVSIGELTLGSEAPLSFRDANGLASCLALSLADEYGQGVPPGTIREASLFISGLTHNWSEAGDDTGSVYH